MGRAQKGWVGQTLALEAGSTVFASSLLKVVEEHCLQGYCFQAVCALGRGWVVLAEGIGLG
jgi:hypothetical protein